MSENQYIYLNSDPAGNELHSDAKVAAQMFLGLAILIITLLLALPRFQKVKLVLELIFEAVRTLVRIVVLIQQLILDLHQIISMANDGFQQVVSVLELIVDVVGSLVSLVDLLRRLIGTCRAIWSICTARQPAAVANDPQNDVIVNEESNI
nr:hypothetical protein CFP56_46075 [Quercus suber]